MKYYDLTKQEEQILKSFEKGQFKSINNFKSAKKRYQSYAENTLSKIKNINLRLSEKDLLKFKSRAAEAGIPYQTLASSLLHCYANA